MADRTSGGVYNRRAGAKARLELQLKAGIKPSKKGWYKRQEDADISISDSDISRIEREIKILDKKLTN